MAVHYVSRETRHEGCADVLSSLQDRHLDIAPYISLRNVLRLVSSVFS